MEKMNETRRAFFILIGLNALWAPVNWAIQTAMADATPVAIGLIRFSIFAAAMMLLTSIRPVKERLGVINPIGLDALKAFVIGLLLAGPAHAIYYTALVTASTSQTTTINTTGPFWTTLFAIALLHEKVSRLRWFAIALGAVGAYIVAIGFQWPEMTAADQKGNLLYLVGTLMECLAFVLAARLLRRSSGLGVLRWEMTGVAVSMALWPLIFPAWLPMSVTAVTWPMILAIAYLAFVAGVLCFGVWYATAETAPVSLMLITLGMQAPIASLIGVTVLGEPLSPGLMVGTFVILGALTIGAYDARRREQSGEPTEDSAEREFVPEPS